VKNTYQHILCIWFPTSIKFDSTNAHKNLFKCFEFRDNRRSLVQGLNKFIPIFSAFIVRCGWQMDRRTQEGAMLLSFLDLPIQSTLRGICASGYCAVTSSVQIGARKAVLSFGRYWIYIHACTVQPYDVSEIKNASAKSVNCTAGRTINCHSSAVRLLYERISRITRRNKTP
jgi:hypothetical protein